MGLDTKNLSLGICKQQRRLEAFCNTFDLHYNHATTKLAFHSNETSKD